MNDRRGLASAYGGRRKSLNRDRDRDRNSDCDPDVDFELPKHCNGWLGVGDEALPA